MTLVMASDKEKIPSLIIKCCFFWDLFLTEVKVHSPHRTQLVLREQEVPTVGAETHSWFNGVIDPFTAV